MKNYKTTLCGIAAGIIPILTSLFNAYNAGQFTGQSTSQILMGIAIIVMGCVAKDFNVTGGTTPVDTTDTVEKKTS